MSRPAFICREKCTETGSTDVLFRVCMDIISQFQLPDVLSWTARMSSENYPRLISKITAQVVPALCVVTEEAGYGPRNSIRHNSPIPLPSLFMARLCSRDGDADGRTVAPSFGEWCQSDSLLIRRI